MNEEKEAFPPKWVEEHLILKEDKAVSPDRDGYDRIAKALKEAFVCEMRKNEPPPLGRAAPFQVLGFHISVDGRGVAGHRRLEGAPDGWSHGDEAFQKQRRWHAHVLTLAEVTRAELNRVNPPSVDIGYSKDGPIVRMLVDAIPIITGEHPHPAAIAQKLKRS
jgi:hypothetical protein